MKSMKTMKSKSMKGGKGGSYVGGTVLDQVLQEVPSNVVGGAKKPRAKKMMGGSDAIPHMVGGVASSSMAHVVGGKAKKTKGTRPLSAYNMFVKDNYEKAKHLPAKDRMSHIAKMWKDSKK
jgi:hypothetical protein